ncbi:hypothetical protein BGM19_38900 [Streptomyces agglomeratus]|uniref:hypothetical protein n=1 Tax=Streptomyces agglomeratus TaxID=285458 RepID=UPI000869F3E2|nr:hypothetical protein [Streptomyces agglomeratus]OEJ56607.1 hypothetical protein BGM19_38900 [Streptomyces agglomeratus]
MTNRYGQPIRTVREANCPHCRTTAEMIHLRVDSDADVRRCGECGEETELELLVYAKPSEVTHPGAG